MGVVGGSGYGRRRGAGRCWVRRRVSRRGPGGAAGAQCRDVTVIDSVDGCCVDDCSVDGADDSGREGAARADVGVSLPSTTVPARVFVSVKDSLSPVCQGARGAVALPVGPTLGCRIVAAYGNPLSKGMGILGRLPRDAMLADLAARTASWQRADPARSHRCALELIAISVQAAPGASGLYRA